tara:strand:- start:285 stop:581 length:297 start_codon:yes stop_codon:yes gene_type:complete
MYSSSSSSANSSGGETREGAGERLLSRRGPRQKDVYGELGSMHSHGEGMVSTDDVLAMWNIQRHLQRRDPRVAAASGESEQDVNTDSSEEVAHFLRLR